MSHLAKLAASSTCIVVLGVPEGTEIGLDLFTAAAGPQFLGFKLVPEGAHLLVTAPRVGALRSSLWLHAPPGGVVRVTRWLPGEERLVLLPLGCGGDGEARAAAGAAAALGLDARLGAYPLERAEEWRRLTAHVTPELLSVVGCGEMGAGGGSRGGRGLSAAPAPTPPGVARELARDVGGSGGDGGAPDEPPPLRLLRLPGVGAGAAASDRTAHGVDSSGALRGAAEACGGAAALAARLLGELQLAFALMLVGQSHEGLSQWKVLADAVLRAEDALLGVGGDARALTPAGWEAALCAVLPPQLEAAGEVLGEGEGGGGFLPRALRALAGAAARAPAAPDAPLARAPMRRGVARLLRRAAERARAAGVAAASVELAAALDAGAAAAERPPPPQPTETTPAGAAAFASVEALLEALRAEAGDEGDLPTVAAVER
jgi:hypothetical protein